MSREEAERIEAMLASRPKDASLPERREGFETMATRFDPPDGTKVAQAQFGGVPGRRITAPNADPGRVLFWLHGGAFTVGSSASYTELCGRLSAACKMAVVCIDYRLSPEHAYPAALNDTMAAWTAVAESAEKPKVIALGGDSCGANLAIALTQRLVREGRRLPGSIYLLSPYLDLTHSGDTIRTRDHLDAFVRPKTMPQTAAAYLGDTPSNDPGASPMFGDVDGFPPVLTHVGSREVLYDDAARFHAKLTASGVPNELVEWEGMPHVFAFFGPLLEEGRRATTQAGAWLAERVRGRALSQDHTIRIA